jgi:hypothetical protein
MPFRIAYSNAAFFHSVYLDLPSSSASHGTRRDHTRSFAVSAQIGLIHNGTRGTFRTAIMDRYREFVSCAEFCLD